MSTHGEINPQPLPPGSENELNPQPLPPGGIDLGHLTETVTRAIQNALTQGAGRSLIPNPRIIVGIIAEPHVFRE
jgi:hypothetical protein